MVRAAGESMSGFAYAFAFVLVGVAVLLVPLASQSLIARLAGALTLLVLLRLFFRLSRPYVAGRSEVVFAPPDDLVVAELAH
jgi:thiol:disulfide interchange protein